MAKIRDTKLILKLDTKPLEQAFRTLGQTFQTMADACEDQLDNLRADTTAAAEADCCRAHNEGQRWTEPCSDEDPADG